MRPFTIHRQIGTLALLCLGSLSASAQTPMEDLRLPGVPRPIVVRTVPIAIPRAGEEPRPLVITASFQQDRGTIVEVQPASYTVAQPLRSVMIDLSAEQKKLDLQRLRHAENALQRLDALAALAQLDPNEHAELVPALLHTIQHDTNASVRIDALRRIATWQVCRLDVIVRLEQMHTERDAQVKAEAMTLLTKLQSLMGGEPMGKQEVLEVPLQLMR